MLKAFFSNPQLFIFQMEFARSSNNLSEYEKELHQTVANVHRKSVPSNLYVEDAHLVAFSYMFDVCLSTKGGMVNGMYMVGIDVNGTSVCCTLVSILMCSKVCQQVEGHQFHDRLIDRVLIRGMRCR